MANENPNAGKNRARSKKAIKRARKKKVLLVVSLIVVCLAALIIIVLIVLLKGRMDAQENAVASASVEDFQMTYAGEKTDFSAVSQSDSTTSASSVSSSSDTAETPELPTIDLSGINSQEALMERLSDGAVAAELNSTDRIYPASMTKMLTTITALEHIDDLNKTYTFDGTEFNRAYNEGATTAGFSMGETVPYIDILYGIMLPSGADACYAICNAIAGSEEAFVVMMNQEAAKIGMTNSNFTNSVGLQDENLFSTCEDIAKLLKYCLQNDTFRSIFTTHMYTTSPTNEHENGFPLGSTTFTNIESTDLPNGTVILGGKTGYTDEAGHCLASLAQAADGTEYILVTAGAAGGPSDYTNLQDAVTIFSQIPGSPDASMAEDEYSGDLDFGESTVSVSSSSDTAADSTAQQQ